MSQILTFASASENEISTSNNANYHFKSWQKNQCALSTQDIRNSNAASWAYRSRFALLVITMKAIVSLLSFPYHERREIVDCDTGCLTLRAPLAALSNAQNKLMCSRTKCVARDILYSRYSWYCKWRNSLMEVVLANFRAGFEKSDGSYSVVPAHCVIAVHWSHLLVTGGQSGTYMYNQSWYVFSDSHVQEPRLNVGFNHV